MADPYRLIIKRSAERDLRRLPRELFLRLNKQILALREEPRPAGVRKMEGSVSDWRLRVGDYRLLYEVNDTERTVTIVRVRHRRDVYRP